MIQSMTHMVLYIIIVVAILLLIITRQQPLLAAWGFIRKAATSWLIPLHFAAMLLILYVNKLELRFETVYPIKLDMTPWIHKLEGNWIALLQSLFQHDVLTYVLVFFYVVVFPALLVTSLIVYVHRNHLRLFYTLCYAIMINYLIAIPFYLFFPVDEVWAYAPSGVHFFMLEAFPTFETEYRGLSGLNNCFPSLHTSISLTLALIARQSGMRAWTWIASLSAGTIIFSIFYLGIHWFTDMLGGAVLALFAVKMSLRLSAWSVGTTSSVYGFRLRQRERSTTESIS